MDARNWRFQRKLELWMAAVEPTALLVGLWGLVFHVQPLLIGAVAGFAIGGMLSPSWLARGARLAFLALLLLMGSQAPGALGLTPFEGATALALAVSSLSHLMSHFGSSHRLMEKLIESGEFFQGSGMTIAEVTEAQRTAETWKP